MSGKRAQKQARRKARRDQKAKRSALGRERREAESDQLMLRAVEIMRDPARVQEQLARFEALLAAPPLRWLRVPVELLVNTLVDAGAATASGAAPAFRRRAVQRSKQEPSAPDVVTRLVGLYLDRRQPEPDRVTFLLASRWFMAESRDTDAADAAWAAVLSRTIRDHADVLFATLARRAARIDPGELRRSLVEAGTPALEIEQLVQGLAGVDDLALELGLDEVVGEPAHLLQAARRFASESVDELCSAGLTARLSAEALSSFEEALALDADAAALERLRARLEADLAALDEEKAALARDEAPEGAVLGRLEPEELDALRLELVAALASLTALPPVQNPLLRSLYSRALREALDSGADDVDERGWNDDDDDDVHDEGGGGSHGPRVW